MSNAEHFGFNFLRAIEIFVAVVETRHITRAAEMLGITQSAVSQNLKNLQQALDTELFATKVRPIQLTQAGIALHRRALEVLDRVEALRQDVRREIAVPLPVLRIAMLASIATTLSAPIARLARSEIGIPEISLFAGLSSDHQNLLRARRIDLAITSDAFFDLEGLIRRPVLTEQFMLVTPRAYRGRTDDFDAVARALPFVRFSRETPVGQRVDQHLRRVRIEPGRQIEGDRASVIMAPVAAGIGFAILTPSLLIDGLAEGMEVEVHPLPLPAFNRDITLVARETELGDLPDRIADACADVLIGVFERRLPHLSGLDLWRREAGRPAQPIAVPA
ncbi:MAG: LysR family transcriptional regulator [Hyphomicrobiaceae bacterium]